MSGKIVKEPSIHPSADGSCLPVEPSDLDCSVHTWKPYGERKKPMSICDDARSKWQRIMHARPLRELATHPHSRHFRACLLCTLHRSLRPTEGKPATVGSSTPLAPTGISWNGHANAAQAGPLGTSFLLPTAASRCPSLESLAQSQPFSSTSPISPRLPSTSI